MTLTSQPHDVSVYIGRFQIFHNGQLALLQRALNSAPLCIVVLGSAFQARTPKNPFTWQERAEMIRLALPKADHDRIRFLPLRDYYDQARWVAVVKQSVAALVDSPQSKSWVLVGHFKDASSDYLHDFAGWTLDAVDSQGQIDASALRDAYFANASGANGADSANDAGATDANNGPLDAALAAMVSQAPASTLAFLKAWAVLPYFKSLAQEWKSLRDEKAKWASAPYPPVFVTVDAVVQCGSHVLLIQRGQAPGKGLFAVPGGFIEQRETVYQSTLRELEEETDLQMLASDMQNALKAVKVFDHPDRSQRGRVISHAHWFDLGPRQLPEVHGGDDAASAEWMPVDKLAGMEDQFHDDHFHMLDYFFGLTPLP